MEFTEKSDFQGGDGGGGGLGITKNQYIGGNCLKRGHGGGGGLIPQCTLWNDVGESSELVRNWKLLNKVLSKLIFYKVITPDTADHSNSQYSKFVTTVVKEN